MTAQEVPSFSEDEEGLINNHVNIIAAYDREKFDEYKRVVAQLYSLYVRLGDFLQPDRPGAYNLCARIGREVWLAMEVGRRAAKIREARSAGAR